MIILPLSFIFLRMSDYYFVCLCVWYSIVYAFYVCVGWCMIYDVFIRVCVCCCKRSITIQYKKLRIYYINTIYSHVFPMFLHCLLLSSLFPKPFHSILLFILCFYNTVSILINDNVLRHNHWIVLLLRPLLDCNHEDSTSVS